MDSITPTQKDKAERAVYRGIDAVQSLADMGLGSSKTERAFSALREIEHEISLTRIRERRSKIAR